MASSNTKDLCNGVPIDHRLKRLLQNANQKHSLGMGYHADIIQRFGSTLVRDNKTCPSKDEAGFAAWLAKPDNTGGLVVALLQPAKTQKYTPNYAQVKAECATLAYLDESLTFVNGPGGLTTTSVFDAFPFNTNPVPSGKLPVEAAEAYKTFLDMLEAKKPEVVLACWQVNGQNFKFSGKGVGRTEDCEIVPLSDGHIVRVVNGFHPSYTANYHPNESCFRRLFSLELCKALCVLNSAWQEEDWMRILRSKCRARTLQLIEETGKDSEQDNTDDRRVLRSSRGSDSARKSKALFKSFLNGLGDVRVMFRHMISLSYNLESSQDFYDFLVIKKNTSEGICDALLAVSEAMKRLKPEASNLDASSLVTLSNDISEQVYKFLKDDIPNLVCSPEGMNKHLWNSQFATSTSTGLKRSIEHITIRFIENLTNSFPELMKSSTYNLGLLQNAFQEFAVNFEDSLSKEYEIHRRSKARNISNGVDALSASLSRVSLSSSQGGGLTSSAGSRTPRKTPTCYKCNELGHYSNNCSSPRSSSTTSATPPPKVSCYNCNERGHYSPDCTKPKRGSTTPSSASRIISCYNCDEPGHYSPDCTRPKRGSTTPLSASRSTSCYNCKEDGHYSRDCKSPMKRGKCFRCGGVGHWTNTCALPVKVN